jgi:hypothetical protein
VYIVDSVFRKHVPQQSLTVFDWANTCTSSSIGWVAKIVFGLRDARPISNGTKTLEIDKELIEHAAYLEKRIERLIASAKEDLVNDMANLEKRLAQSGSAAGDAKVPATTQEYTPVSVRRGRAE